LIERMTFLCGTAPKAICSGQRSFPNNSCCDRILSMTCWGLPRVSAGRERRRRGRHREVWAMVLADTEDIQTDLIGQGHLLQEILKALPGL
jgi:hypothetical protein